MGKKLSAKTRLKIKQWWADPENKKWKSQKQTAYFQDNPGASKRISGSRNGSWKGDAVGYDPLHKWARKNIPKPKVCTRCGLDKRLEIAAKNARQQRRRSDWEWACHPCNLNDGIRKHPRFRKQEK